jgi:hypothetical protein
MKPRLAGARLLPASVALAVFCGWTVLPPKLEILSEKEFLVTCKEDLSACGEKARSHCQTERVVAIDTTYKIEEKTLKPNTCPPGMQPKSPSLWAEEDEDKPPECVVKIGLPVGVGPLSLGVEVPLGDSTNLRGRKQRELNKAFKVRYSCDSAYFQRRDNVTEEVLDSGDDE